MNQSVLHLGGQGLLRDDINSWVHVSDESVLAVALEEVLECEAYMLFYQAVDSLPAVPQPEGEGEKGGEAGEAGEVAAEC